VVHRRDMKSYIARALDWMTAQDSKSQG